MVKSTTQKPGTDFCQDCKVRIPKNRPKLFCSHCELSKHFRCQNLTKNDAQYIIDLQIPWTCSECLRNALPINACQPRKRTTINSDSQKFKANCTSCNGWSYSPRNIRKCSWCDGTVHLKCFKNDLGCTKCCNDIIPGYNFSSYELNMDFNQLNNFIFNPYDNNHFSNSIGDRIGNAEQNNDYWNQISEILLSCNYKQQKNVKMSTCTELKIFSLNVQSFGNKVEHFRQEIEIYNKYDVLCLCETNITKKKVTNDLNDIILDGFYDPFVQEPLRKSGRGGGLIIFVNKRVCDYDQIEPLDPNLDPTDCSGEFQFFKLHKCKGFSNTKIIGNIYRSPSRSPDNFVALFDTACRSLNRHSRKHVILAGDFNIDLLKHENLEVAQKLIETASKYGFLELVSRPTRITDHSCTLIDHVYSNDIHNTHSCNIITVGISDHLATLTTISLGKAKLGEKRAIKFNCRLNNDIASFRLHMKPAMRNLKA